MARSVILVAAALGLLAVAGPGFGQPKKEEPKTKKQFHDVLHFEYPADAGWRDLGQLGLGIRFPDEGVVIVIHRQYWETPGGQTRGVIEINGQKVPPTNTSRLVKELQKQMIGACKEGAAVGGTQKFSCKAGKGVYCDAVVCGGKEQIGIKEIELFTRAAAGVDATRSFDPRTIKMHYRPALIKAKDGVHFLTILATEGVLKTRHKEITHLLKSLTPE
ncbi:MAG: hypothetical protein JXQ29_11215 [Planctomycetes bacterium]|nr:hypothetical protein [Planctomycetota bacterium]